MIGISIYLQDLDTEYIKAAAANGTKYIFSSLHIPEEDYSDIETKLGTLLKVASDNGIDMVPDISPVTFERLGIKENDYEALQKLGFNTVRLDYGFDEIEQYQEILKYFDLILNASTLSEELIEKIVASDLDMDRIAVMHNFYPKTNTALAEEDFLAKNKKFIEHNIRVQAFVPGEKLKRFPLYEGLPTLEKHRQMPAYVAALDLLINYGVDDVFIGDSKTSVNTLKAINSFIEKKELFIPAFIYKESEDLLKGEVQCRRDASVDVIRITTPRVLELPATRQLPRLRGSITMDNGLYGRYSGEVQLCKHDLPLDARVNLIGFIHPNFTDLLELISSDYQLKFVPLDFFE